MIKKPDFRKIIIDAGGDCQAEIEEIFSRGQKEFVDRFTQSNQEQFEAYLLNQVRRQSSEARNFAETLLECILGMDAVWRSVFPLPTDTHARATHAPAAPSAGRDELNERAQVMQTPTRSRGRFRCEIL
jgi:hypothetical protein